MAQFLDATTQNIASQELCHISVIHIGEKSRIFCRVLAFQNTHWSKNRLQKKIGIIPNITEGSFKNKLGPFFHPPPFLGSARKAPYLIH